MDNVYGSAYAEFWLEHFDEAELRVHSDDDYVSHYAPDAKSITVCDLFHTTINNFVPLEGLSRNVTSCLVLTDDRMHLVRKCFLSTCVGNVLPGTDLSKWHR